MVLMQRSVPSFCTGSWKKRNDFSGIKLAGKEKLIAWSLRQTVLPIIKSLCFRGGGMFCFKKTGEFCFKTGKKEDFFVKK